MLVTQSVLTWLPPVLARHSILAGRLRQQARQSEGRGAGHVHPQPLVCMEG